MKKRVRVISTYEVEVEAEYGDTPESLIEKGLKAKAPKKAAVDAVLMPDEVG